MKVEPLEPHEVAVIRVAIGRLGELQTAERLGVSMATLGRSLTGLTQQPGTVHLIRSNLEKLNA